MPVYSLSAQEPEPTVIDRVIEIDKAIEEDPYEKRKRQNLHRAKNYEQSVRNAGLVQGVKLSNELLEITKGISYRAIVDDMLVYNEGYREKPYKDSKGIWTGGIGATGSKKSLEALNNTKAIYDRFDKDVVKHEKRAREGLGDKVFEGLHPVTQAFVVDSYFRGGLAGSRNTRNFIKQGKFKEAGEEFLKGTGPKGMHKEYYSSLEQIPYWSGEYEKDKKGNFILKDGKKVKIMKQPGPGVALRMKRFSDHLKALPTK